MDRRREEVPEDGEDEKILVLLVLRQGYSQDFCEELFYHSPLFLPPLRFASLGEYVELPAAAALGLEVLVEGGGEAVQQIPYQCPLEALSTLGF